MISGVKLRFFFISQLKLENRQMQKILFYFRSISFFPINNLLLLLILIFHFFTNQYFIILMNWISFTFCYALLRKSGVKFGVSPILKSSKCVCMSASFKGHLRGYTLLLTSAEITAVI